MGVGVVAVVMPGGLRGIKGQSQVLNHGVENHVSCVCGQSLV